MILCKQHHREVREHNTALLKSNRELESKVSDLHRQHLSSSATIERLEYDHSNLSYQLQVISC